MNKKLNLNQRVPIWVIFLTVLSMVSHLSGCQSRETPNHADSAEKRHQENLRLAAASAEPVAMASVTNELNLTGKITANQDKMVKVFPLVGGHIESIKAELGSQVQKGQVLAIIQSGDLADLEQQATTARSQLAVAQKNLQVTQDMAASGLTSQREVVADREQFAAAQGELVRVTERRRIVGGSGSRYIVKAPVSGFIVEKSASPGMELRTDDSQSLFTISNLDQVWVLANVYETDVANIHEGEQARITTLAYPDKVYKGRIDKLFSVLDPDSKTMKVRITLPNPGFKLKPEMFTNVIVTYPGRGKRIAVPAKALVFDKSRNFVVAVTAKNQPVVREVDIFKTSGDTSYLNSGLMPGERVVTKDPLLLYNALTN
jgi:cobalt-zinc-cadmium efflux system membrane fusion protein